MARSCLAASFFYLTLAAMLRRGRRDNYRLLVECFLALGVVFATLAIPFALDSRWTSAAWALEGAAIVWVGIRQDRKLARAFGLLLQLGAGLSFYVAHGHMPAGIPWIDATFIGALLVSLAGLWTSRLLGKAEGRVTRVESQLVGALFVWGFGWWVFAGHHDIESFLPRAYWNDAHVAFVAVSAWGFSWLSLRRDWRQAAWPALVLLPWLFLQLIASLLVAKHPFANEGWLAWAIAVVVMVWTLRKHAVGVGKYVQFLHAGTALLVAALGALELHWVAVEYTARGTAWSVASVLVVPAVVLLALVSRRMDTRWPVAPQETAYRIGYAVPIGMGMLLWILYSNVSHDGRSDPLPYLPLLNALDLGHVLVALTLTALAMAWRRTSLVVPEGLRGRTMVVVLAALAFVWANGVLLRTIHHWADVPYRLGPMSNSILVQAALSLFWSLIALALMLYATRRAQRTLWMVGAALMAVVVAKLFLVDLSHIGGIERIVSFIGVGVLMLVIGYSAPVPPRLKVSLPLGGGPGRGS